MVDLRPSAYQYPLADPATASYDADWLNITGEVSTADGSHWRFADPCLLAYETPILSSWLREVARRRVAPLAEGYESAFGLLLHGNSDFLLNFTEPNLAFSVAQYGDASVRIRVHLSAEARPSWASTQPGFFYLPFDLPYANLFALADEWDRNCEPFPIRSGRAAVVYAPANTGDAGPVTLGAASVFTLASGTLADGDPHPGNHVWWLEISQSDIDDFRAVLSAATSERPLQAHLEKHPILLVQDLRGGHGRWVLPQKQLGSQFRSDFIIGARDSSGFQWTVVELQSPVVPRLFTKKGRNSEQLDEGIRQIRDWRRWLAENRDYANRPASRNGLGLPDIDDKVNGLVIIGRDGDRDDYDAQRLRQLAYDHRIEIHSYDWLVREAESRLHELRRR